MKQTETKFKLSITGVGTEAGLFATLKALIEEHEKKHIKFPCDAVCAPGGPHISIKAEKYLTD